MGYGDSFVCFRPFNGACGNVSYRAEGDDCQVFAVFQFTPFAYGDFFQWTFPVYQYAASTRVTDNERTLIGRVGLCTSAGATRVRP